MNKRVRQLRGVGAAVLAGIVLATTGCGSVSVKYSPLDFDKSLTGPSPRRYVAADIIDARRYNTVSLVNEKKLEKDLAELRASVRKQLVRDGMAASPQVVVAAPRTVADVENVLAAAAKEGADAALFLRLNYASFSGATNKAVDLFFACAAACAPLVIVGLVPLCIVSVLPVNEENASATVEAIVIDPKTRTLLGRFKEDFCYTNSATLWTHDPKGELPDVLGEAVQKALTSTAKAAKDGFVNRKKEKLDLQSVVVPVSEYILPRCIFGPVKTDKEAPGETKI